MSDILKAFETTAVMTSDLLLIAAIAGVPGAAAYTWEWRDPRAKEQLGVGYAGGVLLALQLLGWFGLTALLSAVALLLGLPGRALPSVVAAAGLVLVLVAGGWSVGRWRSSRSLAQAIPHSPLKYRRASSTLGRRRHEVIAWFSSRLGPVAIVASLSIQANLI